MNPPIKMPSTPIDLSERGKYPIHDPLGFLVDDEVVPFEDDQRFDLTGTLLQACPIVSTGLFIVHSHKVPENTAEVVAGMFPHCWQRTNPGGDPVPVATSESVELIDPRLLAGWALFDLDSAKKQPFQVSHDYNIPTISTSPNNLRRDKVRGTTFLSSDEPLYSTNGMQNSLRVMYFPGGSTVRVLFRITPQLAPFAGVAGLIGVPGQWAVGNGDRRIAFAGAKVIGVRMPEQRFKDLRIARVNGMLGPEASSALKPLKSR